MILGPEDPVCHIKSISTIDHVSGESRRNAGYPLEYYRNRRNFGRRTSESFHRHGVYIQRSVNDTIHPTGDGQAPKGLDI